MTLVILYRRFYISGVVTTNWDRQVTLFNNFTSRPFEGEEERGTHCLHMLHYPKNLGRSATTVYLPFDLDSLHSCDPQMAGLDDSSFEGARKMLPCRLTKASEQHGCPLVRAQAQSTWQGLVYRNYYGHFMEGLHEPSVSQAWGLLNYNFKFNITVGRSNLEFQ